MNIRKFLCRIFHGWGWLYRVADCKRYAPTPPPLPPEPPAPPPPPPIEYISIKVCTVSGLLPNQYCPKTKEAQFIKGQEPASKCTLHGEPLPPPPPKPQRPKMLIGTSVYELLEFAEVDIAWFLEALHKTGANCTEIFTSYTWSRGAEWQPYLKVGELYDLTKPNPVYWAKLRFIMAKCAALDMTLIIRLFDYCSMKTNAYYDALCWKSNIQKKQWKESGKAWGGFYGSKPKEYYAAYIKSIAELAKETGCHIQLQAINEADYKASRGEIENWIGRTLPANKDEWNLTATEKDIIDAKADKVIHEFHLWIWHELDKYGYLLQYISTNAKYKKTIAWAISKGILYEVHGCNSPEAVNEVYVKYGFAGACANGDGPDRWATGRHGDKPEKREPSIEQGAAIGKMIKDKRGKIYCYFNRNTEAVSPFDLQRAKFDVIEAIVKAAI